MFLDNFDKIKQYMVKPLRDKLDGILHTDAYKTTCEGHFHLDCLDKNDNVIDSFDDHNIIVTTARQSMAEIFFKSDCKYAHKLVIGTRGCKEISNFRAKDELDGVVKERTRIFSETDGNIYSQGTTLEHVNKGDIFAINIGDGVYYYEADNSYEYLTLDEESLKNCKFTETAPYYYSLSFALNGIDSGIYDNLCTSGNNDIVRAEQKDTSVIFYFYIDTENGNKQYNDKEIYDIPTTLFNEAGLYVNDRLFAMRTFPSKIKDESVKLRIIWTITF